MEIHKRRSMKARKLTWEPKWVAHKVHAQWKRMAADRAKVKEGRGGGALLVAEGVDAQ